MSDFNIVEKFENKIAEFFGAPYAVAVDSCTHGIELCLRYKKSDSIYCPTHTYISVPMLSEKLGIPLYWKEIIWNDYYYVNYKDKIIDAAVLWKRNSYIKGTFMCISFQYKKHLNLGRGGIILTDSKRAAIKLKKMSYDGRLPNIPWREQNIDTIGYHYYMTPETAELGLSKLPDAIKIPPKKWNINDWPNISKMKVFKNMGIVLK